MLPPMRPNPIIASCIAAPPSDGHGQRRERSEEHTSELQSQSNLVCRLLLEKKKKEQVCSHDQGSVSHDSHREPAALVRTSDTGRPSTVVLQTYSKPFKCVTVVSSTAHRT